MDFNKIKSGLIVSCQAEGEDPFNTPEGVTMFAKAAVMGGAAAIRSRDIDKTKMIVENVSVPVIGLTKSEFEDGTVRITGSFKEVEEILKTGCDIVAVDGTFRQREKMNGPQFITEIKIRFNCTVMADISTYSEGFACADFGADCVSSTLSGYTPDTKMYPKDVPDFDLVERLARKISIPVIAEGKMNKPEFAAEMIDRGAWAVVVGTAITRPRIITRWYVDQIKSQIK